MTIYTKGQAVVTLGEMGFLEGNPIPAQSVGIVLGYDNIDGVVVQFGNEAIHCWTGDIQPLLTIAD